MPVAVAAAAGDRDHQSVDLLLTLLFAGIMAVSIWGAFAIPRDRRFAFGLGVPPSVQGSVGKFTGLIAYVLIGTILYFGTTKAVLETEWMSWVSAVLLTFFLVMEFFTIRRLTHAP